MQYSYRFLNQLFGLAVFFLLFASYPVALIPPGMEGASYYIRLPSLFILTVIGIPSLLMSRLKLPRLFAVCCIVYLTIIGIHFVRDFSNAKAIIDFLGYLIIPLAFCVYLRVSGATVTSIAVAASLLWLLSVTYGFMNHYQGQEVIGITGNRNWMAITLLALTPWTIFVIFQGLSRLIKSGNLTWLLSVSVVSIPTLFLIFRCRSRAAWLALIVYILGFLLYRIRYAVRVCVMIVVLVITVFAILFRPDGAIQAYVQDIRGPTWISTVQLIADNPLFGVGPGNYTKEHAQYRASSEYHRRRDLADLTTHPHNEFLNIAANIGLIAAISWIILIFPLVLYPTYSGFRNIVRNPLGISSKSSKKSTACSLDRRDKAIFAWLAQFSAFTIFFHSFLDKPLVQPPSNIIGLCCLGILWQPFVDHYSVEFTGRKKQVYTFLIFGYLIFAMWLGARVTRTEWGIGWHRREAVISRNHGEFQRAYNHYRKMTEFDSENIRGYYGAGAIALQNLLDPQLSLESLNNVIRLDPHFAHVNSLLGKAYGTMGDHTKAQDYFERECRLFPSDISAFQYFFASSAQVGDYQQLLRIEEYLKKLYLEKLRFRNQPYDDERLVTSWVESVRTTNFAAAADSARQLCHSIDHIFLDPLFFNIKRQPEWPADFIYSDFNSIDGIYWENIVWRYELVGQLQDDSEVKLNNNHDVKSLFRQLIRDFNIDSNEKTFKFPKDAWDEKRGNSLTFCALFAWVNRINGVQTLICPVAGAKGRFFPLVIDGDSWFRFDLSQKTVSNVDITNYLRDERESNPDNSRNELALALADSKLFFFPEEFFLKHHVLAVVVDEYRPDNPLSFDRMPILEAINVRKRLLEQSIEYDILKAYLPAPLELKEFSIFD